MLAQLVALNDGSTILVDKPVLLLGRHPECDVQIESRKVSRRHCCIALVSDYLVVRDLGSTNGIRINGIRVTEGRLQPGDELTIGSQRYQVRWGAPEAVPRPQAPPVPPPPDDELLEACDEPVPLAEPYRPPPRPPAADGGADPVAPSPPIPPAAPRIVPDQLDLAPASDVLPPGPPRPPSA